MSGYYDVIIRSLGVIFYLLRHLWPKTESDKTAFKPKDVDKVRDPVTNKALKLKKLVKVKFTAIDTTLSDAKRQAAKSRWKVFFLFKNQIWTF